MFSKILFLIGDKFKALKLFVLILIGALIELLSIGALLPTVFLITDYSDNKLLNYLKSIFSNFDNFNKDNFPLIVLLVLAFLFTIKFFYLIFLAYYQSTFSNNLTIRLSDFLKST